MAAAGYEVVSADFELRLSVEKTKGMVVGLGIDEHDAGGRRQSRGCRPLLLSGFYQYNIISKDGEPSAEIDSRIAKASRAFGCLWRPIFQDRNLSVATKRQVYQAVVQSVLLYGAETWKMKAAHVRRLNSFHNRCVRAILGVTTVERENANQAFKINLWHARVHI